MASTDIDTFPKILSGKKGGGVKASVDKLKMTETHAGQMLSQVRAAGPACPPVILPIYVSLTLSFAKSACSGWRATALSAAGTFGVDRPAKR